MRILIWIEQTARFFFSIQFDFQLYLLSSTLFEIQLGSSVRKMLQNMFGESIGRLYATSRQTYLKIVKSRIRSRVSCILLSLLASSLHYSARHTWKVKRYWKTFYRIALCARCKTWYDVQSYEVLVRCTMYDIQHSAYYIRHTTNSVMEDGKALSVRVLGYPQYVHTVFEYCGQPTV
jgi:hypothetical protein